MTVARWQCCCVLLSPHAAAASAGQAPPSNRVSFGGNRTSRWQNNKLCVSQKPLEPWLQSPERGALLIEQVGKWPKEGLVFRAMAGRGWVWVRRRGKWWDSWRGARRCLLRGVSCDLHPLLSFSVDCTGSNYDSFDSRLIISSVCVVWEQTKWYLLLCKNKHVDLSRGGFCCIKSLR